MFTAVKSGLFSQSLTLVPLARASVGRDNVRIDRAESEFKKAPSWYAGVELTLDDEATTFRHYGLDYGPAGEAPAAWRNASGAAAAGAPPAGVRR